MKKVTVRKKSENQRDLKRICEILGILRQLDENWEGCIYSDDKLYLPDGTLNAKRLIGNTRGLLCHLEYGLWWSCDVQDYGYELIGLLKKFNTLDTYSDRELKLHIEWYLEEYWEEKEKTPVE